MVLIYLLELFAHAVWATFLLVAHSLDWLTRALFNDPQPRRRW